jgi:hypothetical protein
VTDPSALKIRDDIGVEMIAWECDYPHSDSIFPDAPEFVLAELEGAGVPDDEINMITWQNTCRFFDWDPFARIPQRQANVGSLRALSRDVDTTVRSKHEWRQRYGSALA